jgi:hypothetical protein
MKAAIGDSPMNVAFACGLSCQSCAQAARPGSGDLDAPLKAGERQSQSRLLKRTFMLPTPGYRAVHLHLQALWDMSQSFYALISESQGWWAACER